MSDGLPKWKICPLCKKRADYGGFDFFIGERLYVAHITCVVDLICEVARLG